VQESDGQVDIESVKADYELSLKEEQNAEKLLKEIDYYLIWRG